jgi:hypothetical protein
LKANCIDDLKELIGKNFSDLEVCKNRKCNGSLLEQNFVLTSYYENKGAYYLLKKNDVILDALYIPTTDKSISIVEFYDSFSCLLNQKPILATIKKNTAREYSSFGAIGGWSINYNSKKFEQLNSFDIKNASCRYTGPIGDEPFPFKSAGHKLEVEKSKSCYKIYGKLYMDIKHGTHEIQRGAPLSNVKDPFMKIFEYYSKEKSCDEFGTQIAGIVFEAVTSGWPLLASFKNLANKDSDFKTYIYKKINESLSGGQTEERKIKSQKLLSLVQEKCSSGTTEICKDLQDLIKMIN